MKNQFKLLTLAASAAMMFTACSSDKLETYAGQPDLNPEAPSNAIQFGTYMGKSTTTRAGWEGSMTTTTLKENTSGGTAKSDGFGVFAYYTGKKTYNEAQYYSGGAAVSYGNKLAANFMFNQQVSWSAGGTDYVGSDGSGNYWKYAPIKYWPNEIASAGVDDQDNDASNNQATGSDTYGGNVSFFAYAPYVSIDGSGLKDGYSPTSTTDGITAINGNTTLAGANAVKGDPTLTYVIASDGKVVDLLWGTLSGTTKNVLGTNNTGVSYSSSATDGTYDKAILDGYTVNADLTKQKTNGTVGFAFKHALAKVGGSSSVDGEGKALNGLMIILDIDDMKGAETGGTLNREETKVTINSVTISNDLNADGDLEDNVNGIAEVDINKGVFNLATGKWASPEKSGSGVITHTIKPQKGSADDATASATLNTAIAELLDGSGNEVLADATNASSNYNTFFGNTPSGSFASQSGVLSDKRLPVYNSEANPFVFIPGTTPAFRITVDYYVRTKDANLSKGYSEVRQVISKIIQFPSPVELNKQYSVLMHIGLTSVKFTAEVSDWQIAGDTDGDGLIGSGETIDLKEVYLPINVQGETTAQSVAAGSNVTVNTAAGQTPYKLTITGLTAGNKLTIAPSDGSNIGSFTVYRADGTTVITVDGGSYTVAAGQNSVVISAPMTANSSTTSAKVNTLTITEKNPSAETVSTTVVNITQNKAVTP